jgi:NADP-dependent 3-hydroxy acid dehydrogenase YdfG
MDPEVLIKVFKGLSDTDVTKIVHRSIYPAIAPSRPELNQAGKTVLITGGGTGVGFYIAKAFVQASADTVIIIGRRLEVLEKAALDLQQVAKAAGTTTKIITRSCDIVDIAQVNALWEYLASQAITVDVLVANVGTSTEAKSMFELGADEVWSKFEVNVKGSIYFTEKFNAQPSDKKKVHLQALSHKQLKFVANVLNISI